MGTVESYYDANMDLLRNDSGFNIWKDMKNVYTHHTMSRPQYIGNHAIVRNTLICDGCTILGQVENSIIFPDVFIDENVRIKDSIVLSGAEVAGSAHIFRSIINEKAKIKENFTIEFADELIPDISRVKKYGNIRIIS